MTQLIPKEEQERYKKGMADIEQVYQQHLQITDRTKEVFKNHYKNVVANKNDMRHLINFANEPHIWKYPKVSWDTFLDHPDYLDIGKNVYSKVRRIGRDIINGNHSEAVILAGIGAGKCLKNGTLVLMADGDTKRVEEIQVGEQVMGDDGTPRNVLELSAGVRGLYKVTPKEGEPFTVTENHILSFKRRNSGVMTKNGVTYRTNNKVVNMKVLDYLKLPPTDKESLLIWRSPGVQFKERELLLDPYFLGLWLSIGNTDDARLVDRHLATEVVDYLQEYVDKHEGELKVRRKLDNRYVYSVLGKNQRKSFWRYLNYYGLIRNKRIPEEFKTSSVEQRKQLLAGLLDARGYLFGEKNCFETSNYLLAKDVEWLARSLGYGAYVVKVGKDGYDKRHKNMWGFRKYRVDITGCIGQVPVKVRRNKTAKRYYGRDYTVTEVVSVEYVGEGKYSGFELDGNHLFCLGDFTVTHNTTTAELLIAYMTHHLLCLNDPHEYYNLAKDKPISIMNMGTTATQALDNVFKGVKTFMKNSQWFQRMSPRILANTISYVNPDILLLSGNSKSSTALGYNVFCGVLDEAAFYKDNDNNNVAEDIYNALQRRIVSRFGNHGLLIAISSPNYEGDFICTKHEQALQYPDLIYGASMPTWQSKPIEDTDLENKFYFDVKNNKLVPEGEEPDIQHTSMLDSPFDPTKLFWEIPGEYKKAFLLDPDKAKRDFAAVPSKAIDGFIAHHDMIDVMFTDQESPVQADGSYKFEEPPLRTSYYIHVDLALNKNGKGDFAGFAMAHCEGWEENEKTGEQQRIVVVDIAERIAAGPLGEVDFEEIRNKIYALKNKGFNIKLVTFDAYQSVDMIQTLKRKNIRAEYMSVDRSIEPYQTFKECIYGKAVTCHKMEVLKDELKTLEVTKNTKVDHPPNGSKDVSDAVCGAVYNVVRNTNSGMGILTPLVDKNDVAYKRSVIDKAMDHERRVQELLDSGLV